MTDPIADLLTRIRNALRARHRTTLVPASTLKLSILSVLKDRKFISDFHVLEQEPQNAIQLSLLYGEDGAPAMQSLKRVSKPGCRIYRKAKEIRPVLQGRGVSLFSTSKGVFSGEEARKMGIGGEWLCEIW